MKTNFKKIAVIFGLVVVMIAALALVVAAEKADFAPPTEFSDITPANGWVQIGTKTGADTVDEDGKDVTSAYVIETEATEIILKSIKCHLSDH